MCKKLILAITFLSLFVQGAYSSQKRLTQHREYSAIGDGAGKIYYLKSESGQNWDIWRMNEDGTEVSRITNDSLFKSGTGEISPDKTKLVITEISDNNDHIYIMNSDGSNPSQIYSTQNSIDKVTFSPDGNKIAFIETEPKQSAGTLYVMNIDGSGVRSLSHKNVSSVPQKLFSDISIHPRNSFSFSGSTFTKNNVNYNNNVAFSTDSAQIVFPRYSDGHLAKIGIDGTNITEISTFSVYRFSLLKTGKILLKNSSWSSNDPYNKLITINSDGTGYYVLYRTSSNVGSFSVSPDESKIALLTYIYENSTYKYNIAIISSDGVLLDEIAIDYYYEPSWASNSKITYSENANIVTVNIDGTNKQYLTNDRITSCDLEDAKGNKIVFSESNGLTRKIYSIDTDGLNKTLLIEQTAGQYLGFSFKLSPDGSRLLYSFKGNTTYYQLLIKNTNGTGTPIVLDEGDYYWIDNSIWSPDGTKIICDSAYYFIINTDGTNKKVLSFPGLNGLGLPVFSPDGTKMVFNTSSLICTAPVDLSTYTIILSTNLYLYPSDWKSNKILLTGASIYSMNSDGSELTLIDYGYGILSPDGTKVVYSNSFFESLNVANIDGTQKVKLSDYTLFYYVWSSNSKNIAYQHFSRQGGSSKIYYSNSDATNNYNLNPEIKYYISCIYAAANNKIVYFGDNDIWVGDYDTSIATPIDVIVPPEGQTNEIKVVVPDGGGYRGTYNPDLGKPATIGFRGASAGNYTLRIFTLLGEQVYTETKAVTSAEGWFEWLPRDIASGVYVVYVNGPGVNIQKKIAILR